ncbi:protein RIC-3 [Sparus aurata]|uniref:RIC3 acetylcholine receptor chaperone n=1 Tax=Sparus aurata TaxID=8175 RepID=A0A671UXC6_SPAAU|nr:protein RIC-3-like [Sparus aurata]
MSITTCQKVTLISCSVLCVSLFLPRILLSRGKKEMGQPEVGPGFYPPVTHQLSLPGDPEGWGMDTSFSMTNGAEAINVKVKGIVRGKKSSLMAQVIPIYGFGIFLYIFYIIYKLTCRGKNTKSENYTTVAKENKQSKILNEHELARLQERLLHTERMMERIVSAKSRGSGSGRRRKSKTSTSKKEEKLLRQLRQITQLMQEGRLEAASPEMEAEQVPYGADWEGYPVETYPVYDDDDDDDERQRFNSFILEEPRVQPTAEALAERMEQEEEEVRARKLSIVKEVDEEDEEEEEDGEEEEEEEEDKEEEEEEEEEEVEAVAEEMQEEEEEEDEEGVAEKRLLLSLPSSEPAAERRQERLGLEVSNELRCYIGGKKQISFSDQRDVFHYPKEEYYEEEEEEKEDEVEEEEEDEGTEAEEEEEVDDDDPVMEAESLQFSCEGGPNPEEEAEQENEEFLFMSGSVEGDGGIQADVRKEVSGLRMRTRRET